MRTRPIILSLLLTFSLFGCERNVNMKENKLESLQQIIEPYKMSGILTRGEPSTLTYQGTTYKVSPYSSKAAQDFIATLTVGAQVSVLFTGGFSGGDVVIEAVSRQ